MVWILRIDLYKIISLLQHMSEILEFFRSIILYPRVFVHGSKVRDQPPFSGLFLGRKNA